ncbi:unnamed protein product [Angiostrongylus costaricensis]|uniref:PKS_ER domain-containing protein n=1 Tax=Angiostrongylus costaricensis TaxID=334426 RepID=A0A0R3PQT3_ANGCS|nr:unnamed protein product [Angiostrongylus costaricensis]
MFAAVVKEFGGPEVIKVLPNIPLPVIQSSKQILIRVGAAGVNPVDTYIRSGQYPSLPTLPYTPGRDGAGIVEKIGADVKHVKVGDRVYFATSLTGSAAEYCLAENVFLLPSGLSLQEGACIGIPYMTAYRAVFLLGKIQKGQRLLVHGASGGVGFAAVQMAAKEGVTVVGTAGTEESIEMVRKNGACEVFNHRSAGYIDEIKSKYPGGFNLIVEMSAHTNLANDLELLAHKGQVAIVGNRGEVTINPRALMMKEASVFGVMLANSITADWLAASSYISKFFYTSKFRPVVAHVYPLSSLSSAHSDIMGSKGAKGKLIVSVNDQL